ncbi:enoyl-CoA hydratase/isomerase family protein [Balneolales bacterium ANBcel1]|nr:enoyl-CoA hydratase/isomerase family protein [Balneolales bacterium ANBcel1]
MAAIKINKKKHIYWAEINHPETNNAIDFKVMDELEKLLAEIEKNGRIRVLILSGTGHHFFASGENVTAFSSLETEEQSLLMAARMGDILHRLEENRFWTMACINGEVHGGGCELLLAFDFAIASKTASFAFTQTRFGVPPGWGGITRLVERVGRSRALEWLGSNEIISSEEALQAGLINKLSITSELRRNTWEWALELAKCEPDLIEELKKSTRLALKDPREKSLKRERKQFARFWASDEHQNRIAEHLKKSGK